MPLNRQLLILHSSFPSHWYPLATFLFRSPFLSSSAQTCPESLASHTMFWRYLNTQGGQIDVLLARDPPPSLEELLDDDELLSELKGQSNTRLIDFLSRPEAIRGLMGWVTKGLESPEKRGRETEEDKKRATRSVLVPSCLPACHLCRTRLSLSFSSLYRAGSRCGSLSSMHCASFVVLG